MRIAVILSFVLILWDCAPRYRPLVVENAHNEEVAQALAMIESGSSQIPPNFNLVQAVVFRKSFFSVSAMGYTSIDRRRGTFAVAGLSPLGVKLFETKGDQNGIEHAFAIEAFTKRGDFIETLAADIRAIYFDLIPSGDSEFRITQQHIIFSQKTSTEKTEYVFHRKTNRLYEKRHFQGGRKLWRVRYTDFQGDHWIPGKIEFKHHRYRYKLSLILKEIK